MRGCIYSALRCKIPAYSARRFNVFSHNFLTALLEVGCFGCLFGGKGEKKLSAMSLKKILVEVIQVMVEVILV